MTRSVPRQVERVGGVVLMLLDRFGDLVTQRRFGIVAEQQMAQTRPQVPAAAGGASTGIVGHDGSGGPLYVSSVATLPGGRGASRGRYVDHFVTSARV